MIGFNLKEEIKELKRKSGHSTGSGRFFSVKMDNYFDLGIAFWLINPDEDNYSPEYLAKKYLHTEWNPLTSSGLKQLYEVALKKLKEYKLEKLFYEVEMPLIAVLADMEVSGIKLNVKSLRDLDRELERDLAKLAKNIYKETGETFNINSPKQLAQILFQKLNINLSGVKKTKTGAISTNEETLLKIQDRHPIAKLILSYRELFKLQSTYARPLQELADKNGRVHTTYVQTGTATGRLSSQNPNLQNIPIESDWATELRKAFIVEKGYKLAAFDYSQIELRVLASLSGDPKMIEAFNNDLDIHKLTAANVFNMSLEKVTPEMRRLAKTLNFGVVYGMGAFAFAKTSGLSVAEARKFIEEYFNDFKKIKEWQEKVKAQARTNGYVTNLNGRRRWLLQATSMFRGEAAEAERAAINMPVQGLAADIIKIAMVKIHEETIKRGWYKYGNAALAKGRGEPRLNENQAGENCVRMLLTIHDELLFEIDEHIIKEASVFIRKIMENAYELEVPIKVNVKIGENWGELE